MEPMFVSPILLRTEWGLQSFGLAFCGTVETVPFRFVPPLDVCTLPCVWPR
jgi:hypothetical protein